MGRNGGMLISASRGCLRPEMSAPFDSLTQSFYKWSVGIFGLPLTVQTLFHVFHLAGISHRGPKIGVLVNFRPPYRDLIVMPTPKHFLHRTASFEPSGVKIGLPVRSVDVSME